MELESLVSNDKDYSDFGIDIESKEFVLYSISYSYWSETSEDAYWYRIWYTNLNTESEICTRQRVVH